jgi:tetratricopeptide (TPR) repeat protein
MYDIIPLIFILIGLSISFYIFFKKFSILASLDTDSIQSEKEAKFKEKILSDRLKRNILKLNFKLSKLYNPVFKKGGEFFFSSYERLVDFKDKQFKIKQHHIDNDFSGDIDGLFAEADGYLKNGDFEVSEKIFLKIISHDSKNIKAFRMLAKLYYEQKNYIEAKQTFQHILRLAEDKLGSHNVLCDGFDGDRDMENDTLQAEIYYYICLINRDTGNIDDAYRSIRNALSVESNNPRYLDIGLEISIIIKDKAGALDLLAGLKSSNPSNNKISDFEARINSL